MSALIAAITSLLGSLSAVAMKAVTFLATTTGGWFVGIGWKLLSFQWIRNVYDFLSNVVSIVKKMFFNPFIVKAVKIIATLGLFALAVVQTVFMAKIFLGIKQIFNGDTILKLIMLLNVAAIAVFIIYLLAFLLGLLKKKLRYGFIAALFFVYITVAFSYYNTGLKIYRELFQSFDTLKVVFMAVLGVLAIFKLADGIKQTSVIAFLLCLAGVILCMFVFNADFAGIVIYGFEGEIPAVASNKVGFIAYIRSLIEYFSKDGDMLSGVSAEIVSQGFACGKNLGSFAGSVAIVFNGLIIAVCTFAPYLLFTVGVGLIMSLLNERVKQIIYISKALKALKYLFLGLLSALVAALILSFFIGAAGTAVSFELDIANSILSFLTIIVLVFLSMGARKLITDKPISKINLKKKIS
ncbi:MAG: hypothetical protein J5911_05170 [Clostridia bacterium]|nr:hypothetical protein [Clostridia bacterium]